MQSILFAVRSSSFLCFSIVRWLRPCFSSSSSSGALNSLRIQSEPDWIFNRCSNKRFNFFNKHRKWCGYRNWDERPPDPLGVSEPTKVVIEAAPRGPTAPRVFRSRGRSTTARFQFPINRRTVRTRALTTTSAPKCTSTKIGPRSISSFHDYFHHCILVQFFFFFFSFHQLMGVIFINWVTDTAGRTFYVGCWRKPIKPLSPQQQQQQRVRCHPASWRLER